MKIKNTSFLCIIVLSLSLASVGYSQTIGKIYSGAEADSIYGTVIDSVNINTSDLQSLILNTSNYIQLNIVYGKLVILDNKRNVLYPLGLIISENEVFKVCSVSILQILLQKGNSAETFVENRSNVLTITNGGYTLEEMLNCPPFCP